MAPTTTLISSLTPNSDTKAIVVRVTRIWEAINKRTGATLHTNVILLDEKDDHMLAIVRNNQKQIYLPTLKEGEIYNISNFKVVPGPKQYRSVEADYSISFFYRTQIEKQTDSAMIPRNKFELKAFVEVKTLVGDVSMLIDVIGMVKSYGKMEKRNNDAHKMDIILTDADDTTMVVTLWEEKANQFINSLPPASDGPVFVVVTGLLAKKFSDAASLSSTDATRCYMNIDYAPLKILKEAVERKNDTRGALGPPTVEQFFTSTGDVVHELPIATILEMSIPDGTQVVRCICRGKIIGILDGNGWFYDCCPTCARALKIMDGGFYCLACDEEPEKLERRFRIVAQVEDVSGTTTVTLFNKEAEQLVGIPIAKVLAEEQEVGSIAAIPPAVNNIIGKFCAFQIKITSYNIIQGCEEYTVTRVTELNDAKGTPSQPNMPVDSAGTSAVTNTRVRKKHKVE